MSKKDILITFYNRGTTEKPIWEVYIWKDCVTNRCAAEFKTKSAAIEYAHSFYLPVLHTSKGNNIAKKLQESKE